MALFLRGTTGPTTASIPSDHPPHLSSDMASDELDELLSDFGRRPSATRRMLYFLVCLPAPVLATLLFTRIFLINTSTSQLTLLVSLLVSTAPLSLSLHNLSFVKSARLRRAGTPPTKGMYAKGEEYSKAVREFEGRIAGASLWYSVGYNFVLYLMVVPCVGVYVLREHVEGDLNMLLAGVAGGGLAWWNSVSALKAIGE